jgi:hypothetical protein
LNSTTSEPCGNAAGPWSSSRSTLAMNAASPHPHIRMRCGQSRHMCPIVREQD